MDIEGAEFYLLEDKAEQKVFAPVKQLWVEFHPEIKKITDREIGPLVRSLEAIRIGIS